MIFDSVGVVWQSNPSIAHDCISLMIYESLRAVWLWNPSVTHDNISLMIYESLGCLGCKMQVSHLKAVH